MLRLGSLGMDSVVRASLGPSLDHPGVAFGVCSVGAVSLDAASGSKPLLVHYVNEPMRIGLPLVYERRIQTFAQLKYQLLRQVCSYSMTWVPVVKKRWK